MTETSSGVIEEVLDAPLLIGGLGEVNMYRARRSLGGHE